MKKHKAKIPDIVYSDQFLRFIAVYATKFKANRGFGKWLEEYKRMEDTGMLKPVSLRDQYIRILHDNYQYSFVCKQAVFSICTDALDATKGFISSNSWQIRVITGEIAIDDDGNSLIDLTFEQATKKCKEMNEEAEEELFKIFKL